MISKSKTNHGEIEPKENEPLLGLGSPTNGGKKQVRWDPDVPPDSFLQRLFWVPADQMAGGSRKVLTLRAVLLGVAAILWSTNASVVKHVLMQGCSPVFINQIRFFFSTIILSPWIPGMGAKDCLEHPVQLQRKKVLHRREKWWLAVQLGFWQYIAVYMVSVGLQTTSAVHASLFVHLNVNALPFFWFIIRGKKISMTSWLSALGVVIGTTILVTQEPKRTCWGDVWCFSAAFFSGLHIIVLEYAQQQVSTMELTSASFWVSCVLNVLAIIFSGERLSNLVYTWQHAWVPILFLAVLATAWVTPLLCWGKRCLPVTQWAILHVMETGSGVLIAVLWLHESMSFQECIGGVLITIAAFFQQKDASERVRSESQEIQSSSPRENEDDDSL